jgi:hypothetical protein
MLDRPQQMRHAVFDRVKREAEQRVEEALHRPPQETLSGNNQE